MLVRGTIRDSEEVRPSSLLAPPSPEVNRASETEARMNDSELGVDIGIVIWSLHEDNSQLTDEQVMHIGQLVKITRESAYESALPVVVIEDPLQDVPKIRAKRFMKWEDRCRVRLRGRR
jgi:hypothetical protein